MGSNAKSSANPEPTAGIVSDPLWYKTAVIYQVHVKAFFDSNNDGVGDFKGLLYKLDYLKDLGVTALWVLPFYPSPLRDDGYDIADYYNVNSDYGTLRDFRSLLREAHRRELRVITELVLNHTSDQHPWFQRARRAKPGSSARDFYVWSDDIEKYGDARIIFKDFEPSNWSWDPVARAYYWHRFYHHQPDLNFDNPRVRKEMIKVCDHWLSMGVDGLRLDAVPYLFEREGTNCENLPETHEFLRELRAHVDEKFSDRMLLAEANQWPEDAAVYFGEGDECHMAFHFPIMPRIFVAVSMEDSFPIIDILEQTPPIPGSCQWAMFLRNHDELTLEMVSDEERDYMYRVYAKDARARLNLGIRRRLAPLLENNRRKMELINILLFSFPGTPVVYYGDELGMGDNYFLGDRDGVRTPMQWSPDRNAGFSRINPQQLYLPPIIDPEYHYEVVNVENQERNLSSLLWWTRRVIAMRKKHEAFGLGSIEFLRPENSKVLAFVRKHEQQVILVVINLSRFAQSVRLPLADYAGQVPVEIFGKNPFPTIRERDYVLTLGPNDHYWFLLRPEQTILEGETPLEPLTLELSLTKKTPFGRLTRERLETEILPAYLPTRRWFGAKARTIRSVRVVEEIPFLRDSISAHLLLVETSYTEGGPELYLMPVSLASGEEAARISGETPAAVIARTRSDRGEGILYDSTHDAAFRRALLDFISRRGRLRGRSGDLIGSPGRALKALWPDEKPKLTSKLPRVEQSNTSVIYESSFILKLYRKLGEGLNPDLEITRYLTEKRGFPAIPPYCGAIEYRNQRAGGPITIGMLQGFVTNEGDAWTLTLDTLARQYEALLSWTDVVESPPDLSGTRFDLDVSAIPRPLHELIGAYYLEMVELLARRTGELHMALASEHDEPDFTPEPFSKLYQRAVFQSMRNLVRRSFNTLARSHQRLDEEMASVAEEIMASERVILERMRRLVGEKIESMKIRVHGDYHLGQVLYTGNDFVIIDFEGEPARPVSERRLKRSPFRDVAGMIRSFHYAAHSSFMRYAADHPKGASLLEPWVGPWFSVVSSVYLQTYMKTVGNAPFVPRNPEELAILLETFLLEKAVYELDYEMNNRPSWVHIPMKGIRQVLASPWG